MLVAKSFSSSSQMSLKFKLILSQTKYNNTAQTHSKQHHCPYLQNSLNYCHSLPSSRRSKKNVWEGSAVATQNPPHCQLLVLIEQWIEELLICCIRDLNFIHCIGSGKTA